VATFNFGTDPVVTGDPGGADVLFDSADPRWVGRTATPFDPSIEIGPFGVRLLGATPR
jgi:hypothetical protein